MKNNENFENQGVRVGVALKSIAKRLYESEIESKLKELGIDIRNSNGEFKNFVDVLSELKDLNDENIMKSSKLLVGDYNASNMSALIKGL
ncbi:phage tail tape measure protein [Clostridium sp.]|uniref:phage tail tape measure protein n=1 Tax=Clostridium sp. TaxID=1506 RepID=UPI001DA908A0|nr:phage tail tape measure protein [Clostridium sp.]MBS5307688.1 phage tail tape measure protein [Clostridium sp.]